MILTKNFLKNEARRREILVESQNRILNFNKVIYAENRGYDLFISHSYLDKELILTLVEIFNQANYSVYVDWINDSLLDRLNVTAKTAKVIKNRINESKGLAYIATSNITNSKWCPWELGIGDGLLQGRACILPILEEYSTIFKGQEYLGIYPYIEYAKVADSNTYDFWVIDSEDTNRYNSLKNWLDGNELISH